MEEMQEFFDGKKLYGDDFSLDEIEKWYEDEKEGTSSLGTNHGKNYRYSWHRLNYRHGFRFLPPNRTFPSALGFGSQYGEELRPISNRIERITIVEPSDIYTALGRREINGTPVTYIKPLVDGSLPFPGECFDLITCFGVLHHIPNVTKVVREFYRCLRPSGYAVVREPTASMGDWRKHRPGLTKKERGIPIEIFHHIISSSGFEIVSRKRCVFPITIRLSFFTRFFTKEHIYNLKTCLLIDELLCHLFAWNNKYHPSTVIDKLRPTAVSYVIRKPIPEPRKFPSSIW